MNEKELTEEEDAKVFGFWIYLMTDLVIFAALFATYVVLRGNTFGGPSARELFHLPSAFAETLILLFSSFTCALAIIGLKIKRVALFWFSITVMLGAAFLVIEFYEFIKFAHEGAYPQRSGFLSSFFILVGTHGFHISIGLLWMVIAMWRIKIRPLSAHAISWIYRMALFWHFLDLVWIFIFTVVYGMGHITYA